MPAVNIQDRSTKAVQDFMELSRLSFNDTKETKNFKQQPNAHATKVQRPREWEGNRCKKCSDRPLKCRV